jgi:DNA polymerase
VVAWLAGQDDLVAAFANTADIYSEFATDVYGRPVNRKRKAIHPETGKEYLPDFVEGFVGKTCILGLGYGMGKDKFKSTLKIGQAGVSVDVTIEEATRIVNLYRSKYEKIAALWGQGQEALKAMTSGFTYELGVGIKLKCDSDGIHLPNGMLVRYANLRKDGQGGYLYDSRYGPVKIYGGKVIENVVQALARIVVFNQMAKIDQWCRKQDNPDAGRRYKAALTVHDEVVATCPEDSAQEVYELMMNAMSKAPSWAATLPVACEGAIGDNYADCK